MGRFGEKERIRKSISRIFTDTSIVLRKKVVARNSAKGETEACAERTSHGAVFMACVALEYYKGFAFIFSIRF